MRNRLAWAFVLLCALSAVGQSKTASIPVLMLSDIHFDPFRDTSKVAKLAAAPISAWESILEEPPSPTQAADFAALQTACKAVKGVDTDETLFDASLNEEKSRTAGLKFVTVSGDLLVHQFDCRYKTTMKTEGGYGAFAAKTATYVIRRLEAAFPAVPVYVALGNNDSGCGDYMLDAHDQFLSGTAKALVSGLRGASAAQAKQAQADYEAGGNFGVSLPIAKTRLLVIDDMYLSKKWKTCAKTQDEADPAAVLTWLKAELDGAAKRGERVWVMGHIPPGIDVYATLKKGKVCSGAGVEGFLDPVGKETLGDVLAAHADTVTLAIFGHTHMDEMKLLPSGDAGVPLKGVPSISPVDGNLPSFTVASIDPATATMLDYTVYVAPNMKGMGAAWAREYSFGETYGQTAFTGAAVAKIAAGFHADPEGATPASKAYEEYFDKGLPISPLVLGWTQYACGIDHIADAGYEACGCPAKP